MKKTELIECLGVCVVLFVGLISIKALLLVVPFFLLYLVLSKQMLVFSNKAKLIALGVLLYVLIGLFTTEYVQNTLSLSANYLILLVVLLMSATRFSQTQKQMQIVSILFCTIVSFITILSLLFYLAHHISFVSLGFSCMTDFKHYYRPIFMLCNDNATLVLCLLPFAFLFAIKTEKWLRYWSIVNLVCVNLCLIFSYSRGIYISTILFYLAVSIGLKLLGKEQRVFCQFLPTLIAVVVVLSVSPVIRQSVFTTLSLTKTESQKRSFDSRLSKLETTLCNNRDVWFGCGDGNYFISNLNNQTSFDSVLAASSNNGIMQLYVERGVFGLVLLLTLLSFILLCSLKHVQQGDNLTIVLLCGLFAVLVRECTFASFSRVNAVMFLCFVMVLLLVNRCSYEKQ